MTAAHDRFAPRSDQDVLRLVLEHPLAWLVSSSEGSFRGSLLPVRPVADAQGRITQLVGHFARSNDHFEALRRNPRAFMLFLGVHGYVSPSWMRDRTQAPTWNYASAQFTVDVTFFEEPQEVEAHLRDLVGAMEADRPQAWGIDEMGQRFGSLARRIIGFRADVREVRAKFKLGQDERDDVYRDIVTGLQTSGQDELLDLMNVFNAGRAR